MEHEILVGKLGGRYWLDDNGRRHYIKRTDMNKQKKNVNEPSTYSVRIARFYRGSLDSLFTEEVVGENQDQVLNDLSQVFSSNEAYAYRIQGITKL